MLAHARPIRTAHRATLVLALLALPAAVAAVSTVPAEPAAAAGTCAELGSYQDPSGIVAPYVASNGASSSSNSRYKLTASGPSPATTLVIRRASDSKVVLELGTAATNWGFSPDQDRFMTYRTNSGILEAQVYNLTASRPAAAVLEHAVATTSARIGFNSTGSYVALTYIWKSSNNTVGTVISDAVTGKQVFEDTYSYSVPAAGGKPFGAAGWGFSPDGDEFFEAWVAGQNAVQLGLVNLATKRTVFSPTMTGTGFWKFSPCGTMLALVEQHSSTMMEISLIRSSNGTTAGSWSGAVAAVTFKVTKESHIATIGGTNYVLAPNK